ncbi:FadR family transcriptional regulator [Alkalihalobacillus clausii]|jgi:GntR family transcriptional regulator, transcriptional repressor for pyruvate dehydrogenase complex|uniref:FadR/GntR family transcriptional regulator n=1 Tax=Shouchella clausii TaxID=79880 RepID=UPI0020401E1E|nr:FadR/GntR family transcriptional regulator [Shouchella clausii]MCM3550776.1 FadR family transcriptional regulator [Shouchella clausii]
MPDNKLDLIGSRVSRQTLAQQVEEKIVDLLITNKLKPGDKLPPEMELISMLGVSRPVLREAMSSLESLGIVKRKTRDGTYFTEKISSKPFSTMLSLVSDNIEAIIEARTSLELGLVVFAAEKISAHDLERLQTTIQAINESVDDDYGEHDLLFHRIIAQSVDNPILQGMVDSLLLTHAKVNVQIKHRERNKTVAHHQAIYDALANRDGQAAFRAMHEHLMFVRNKVLEPNQ